MKRFCLVVVFLLIASVCYGAAIDFAVEGNHILTKRELSDKEVYVTSNTVSFNTVGTIVTFNTTVNKVLVINESSSEMVHVEFDGSRIGWVGTTYPMPDKNDFRLQAGSSIAVDVTTGKIGFIGNRTTGTITYIATSNSRVSND